VEFFFLSQGEDLDLIELGVGEAENSAFAGAERFVVEEIDSIRGDDHSIPLEGVGCPKEGA